MVCGWISYYFDIDDFTNRVMVVLTAMLVVATIVSTVQAVSVDDVTNWGPAAKPLGPMDFTNFVYRLIVWMGRVMGFRLVSLGN